MIVIGIDPDSKANGVAVYVHSKLIKLKSMPTIELYNYMGEIISLANGDTSKIVVNIENVKLRNTCWHKGGTGAAINVGKCHQAQTEVERIAEHFNVKIKLHKPSKQWKKNKSLFEKVTGWKGRSNKDTRSAAYFGYLGLPRTD